MTEKEKMLNGEPYFANDLELIKERELAKQIILEASNINNDVKRSEVYKKLIQTKENASFGIGLKFDYGTNISVGKNFYCNFDCIILDVCKITIGDNCLLGPNVQIYTATHDVELNKRSTGKEYGKPINIGNNVWIGGSAIILPGVTLGDNVVVSAGSVVTKSFEDNVLIAGNPARILREIKN